MKIKHAAYAGILVIVMLVPLLVFAVLGRLLGGLGGFFPWLGSADMAFTIAGFILDIIFTWGFMLLGRKTNNQLLTMSAYVGIAIASIDLLIQLVVTPSQNETVFLAFLFTMLYGLAGIAFGAGLIRLKGEFGTLALVAGILNVLRAVLELISFMRVGYAVTIPLLIVEVMLLFKASKRYDSASKSA